VPVDLVIKNILEAMPDAKANHVFETESLYGELDQLEAKLAKYEELKSAITNKARTYAKVKMSLGMGYLLGYFGFVYWGTYIQWSWDVVEPIAYFIGLTGTIYLSTRYFALQQDYANNNYFEYLTSNSFRKLAPKYGFDQAEYDNCKTAINIVKNKIKMSMLIDL
jgi:hypothetical protein